MDAGAGDPTANWTEAVDDLLNSGDLTGAISLLESVVSRLQSGVDSSQPSDPNLANLRLAAAMSNLADLYSSRGCSVKVDDLRPRSIAACSSPQPPRNFEPDVFHVEKKPENLDKKALDSNDDGEDDWEAIADHEPPDIGVNQLSSHEPKKSHGPIETEFETPRRRGRGSFMYGKDGLYSDEQHDARNSGVGDDSDKEDAGLSDTLLKARKFGTRHCLVLHDFSPSTRTSDLEKYFINYGKSEVVIRWVNDTCALAVLQTAASAYEAKDSIRFPFKVRQLDEDDALLDQVSIKDLEPPVIRPKTSARTANRMIAQVMGLKPSPGFGSNELKKQEQARKDRIRSRQTLKDDAWGSDDL